MPKIHLEENEEILKVVYPNFLAYFWSTFLAVIFLFFGAYLMAYLLSYGLLGQIALGILIVVGFYLLFKVYFFSKSNKLLITNERIIDIDRHGWFKEVMSSLNYIDIKDVIVKKEGVSSMLFGLSTLVLESRTNQYTLDVPKIKNATEIQNYILNLKKEYRHQRKVSNLEDLYKSFLRNLESYTRSELIKVRKKIKKELEYREETGEAEETVV